MSLQYLVHRILEACNYIGAINSNHMDITFFLSLKTTTNLTIPPQAVTMTTPGEKKAIKSRSFKVDTIKVISPKKVIKSHSINYFICKDLGVILAYTQHPSKDNQGFTGKALNLLDDDETKMEELKISFIADHPSKGNPQEAMPADNSATEDKTNSKDGPTTNKTGRVFTWKIMGRFVANPDDCNTKNAEKWVRKQLVPFFNEKGMEYTFDPPPTFKVGMNLSENTIILLTNALMHDDTIKVISHHYPKLSLKQIKDDKNILTLYSESIEMGRRAIDEYLGTTPAKTSESDDDF